MGEKDGWMDGLNAYDFHLHRKNRSSASKQGPRRSYSKGVL